VKSSLERVELHLFLRLLRFEVSLVYQDQRSGVTYSLRWRLVVWVVQELHFWSAKPLEISDELAPRT
jgi:hypothetical protein